MSRNLVNFTRGSQLIGHFGFMFAAGLKAPLMLAAITLCASVWWRCSVLLPDHDSYLCWMRLYAEIYGWFEFDPAKKINLELRHGGHVQLAISAVASQPMVQAAWAKLMAAVTQGAGLAAIVTLPIVAAFGWIATWFGRRSKESRHERGATLATRPALIAEIDAHNSVQRAKEYRRLLGWGWRLASAKERKAARLYDPYDLAGVPFPWRLEQSHAMLIGTTGTGKTVALRDLLTQVRAKGHRAVVFDLTGAFIEAFYDPARDIILNPMDARCPQWSVFDDCTDEASLTAAAEALIPHDGGGSEQFWVLAARMLFVEMCLKLVAEGRATNAALSSELMTASLAHVHRMMEGTVADPLTAPEAARMAESIRAVFNANAKALKMLPTTGPRFSVRDWTQGQCAPGSFLFVSARYVDMAVASRLLTVWMDNAMTTLMAGPRSPDLKLWFLFDELGALHRLPAIEKGLQTVRNYGGAIVAGVHAYAKLKETYGDNMAMTLASLARTKLILATADRESATWCSDFIGHSQFREMEEGYSYGYNNARDAVSLTPRRQNLPLLLPDQLMNLPRLQGFIKFPDGFPAAPVTLSYVDYPVIAEPFIGHAQDPDARSRTNPQPPKQSDDAPGASDQGPGPSSNWATDAQADTGIAETGSAEDSNRPTSEPRTPSPDDLTLGDLFTAPTTRANNQGASQVRTAEPAAAHDQAAPALPAVPRTGTGDTTMAASPNGPDNPGPGITSAAAAGASTAPDAVRGPENISVAELKAGIGAEHEGVPDALEQGM